MFKIKKDDARGVFRDFLDKGQHWCLIGYTDPGYSIFFRILSTHYCFDPQAFPIFRTNKYFKVLDGIVLGVDKEKQGAILVGFAEKTRVTSTDLTKYINDIDDAGLVEPLTAQELEESNRIIFLTGHMREKVSIVEWFQDLIGRKVL